MFSFACFPFPYPHTSYVVFHSLIFLLYTEYRLFYFTFFYFYFFYFIFFSFLYEKTKEELCQRVKKNVYILCIYYDDNGMG